MRTLFGKPIRKNITDEFYSEKLSIEEFKDLIVGHFDAYAENMKHLEIDKPKFIEEWVEQYLAWLDIEQN